MINADQNRTCATCCAYDKDSNECMNLVSFIFSDGSSKQPGLTDCCHEHKTWEEDRREDQAIARFRAKLGLPPRAKAA
jgi:hypothetical protein